MSETPLRLRADAPHGLGGRAIDRDKPLRFQLNGRPINGFAGDTVLSAALASGVLSAGRHGDEPIALDEGSAPMVASRKGAPMPMERTPAIDGIDYVSLGARRDPLASRGALGVVRNLVVGPSRTLNHRFGDELRQVPPWHIQDATATLEVDFAIVGAGLAGLSAAVAASEAGKSVVLVERDPVPGGVAPFFGAVEGEEQPAQVITDLVAKLNGRPNVTILTHSDAFAINGTTLKVHRITVETGRPVGSVVGVEARHVILATGASERLPVFPGNRTPGIVGAIAAHQRAKHFGIWPGARTLFTTPHSYTYRLAMHAADAGIEVQRIVDSRLAPHSRFVDFAKAMGITLASALAPSHAELPTRNKPGLRVGFAVNIDDVSQDATAIETDYLVAAGNWQPDIVLWLRAGGAAAWDKAAGWLAPSGTLATTSIVGAAAGYRTTAAALASGRAAVLTQLGKPAPAIVDAVIEETFEAADAGTSHAPYRPQAKGNAYLDRSPSLLTLKATATTLEAAHLAAQLGLGDIAAAVDIGAISPLAAGTVAAERCTLSGDINDSGWRPSAADQSSDGPAVPPVWLTGRFGDKPQIWAVSAADARSFGPGCLVFTSSDDTDPMKAIGVVFAGPRGSGNGGLALMGEIPQGLQLFVRDSGTAVASRLVEQLRPAG